MDGAFTCSRGRVGIDWRDGAQSVSDARGATHGVVGAQSELVVGQWSAAGALHEHETVSVVHSDRECGGHSEHECA